MTTKNYAVDPISATFHNDWQSHVKLITGPVGSGKTYSCLHDLMFFAMRAIPPSQRVHTGERRAKMLIVRKSYPRLISTVLESMKAAFGPSLDIRMGFPILVEQKNIPDIYNPGETIDIEWSLLAISDETAASEIDKLKSAEWTGGYINEIIEYGTPNIISEMFGRLGRYPSAVKEVVDGEFVNVTVKGKPVGYTGAKLLVADYNKGSETHWSYKWHKEGEAPAGTAFFDYPAPVLEIKDVDDKTVDFAPNPEALQYMSKHPGGPGYWLDLARQNKHNRDYLWSQVLNRYGAQHYGKPVFQNYEPERHLLKTPVRYAPNHLLYIGFDHSGLNPAMAFIQMGETGIIITDELYAFDTPPDDFLHAMFIPHMAKMGYDRTRTKIICDPADPRGRSFGGDVTMVKALRTLNFDARPAPMSWGRDPKRMHRVMNEGLARGIIKVSPNAKWSTAAIAGGYHYKELRGSMAANSVSAVKNEYSHIADAILYGTCFVRLGETGGQGSPLSSGGERWSAGIA